MPTYLYLKDSSGASAPSRTSSSITVGHGLSGASWNDAAYYDIQDRNEHQVQRGRRNHAAKNRRADGYSARAARALRQHQWHDAQNERERSHQNGPQTDAHRLHRGFDHRHAFTAQLLRKFNDQNRILAGEPDQHHQTNLAVNVILQPAQGLRANRSENRDGYGQQHNERQHVTFILRRQRQVHDHDAERKKNQRFSAGLDFFQ